VFEAVGKPKVSDDDIPMSVKEKVLEFEISMYNFFWWMYHTPEMSWEKSFAASFSLR